MKVEYSEPHPLYKEHFIQIGISTWTENEPIQLQTQSVRRAVYNNGVFSPHGSSEVPIEDLLLLLKVCLIKGKIGKWKIIKTVLLSIF